MMKVVQCWDDGIDTDIRVTEILRKYKAKASFNLSFGLYSQSRSQTWRHNGMDVAYLGKDELISVYDGFTIANHTLTHAKLAHHGEEIVRYEIEENRKQLQQFFQQPILGFVYPHGSHNNKTMKIVREAGHLYGRTIDIKEQLIKPIIKPNRLINKLIKANDDLMELNPNCYFLDKDFWSYYEKARTSGTFYFWGHSFDLLTESMWNDFEQKIKTISEDKDACWADVPEIFSQKLP